jgi:hypothetical protein
MRISGKGIHSALLAILSDSNEIGINHSETTKKSPLLTII